MTVTRATRHLNFPRPIARVTRAAPSARELSGFTIEQMKNRSCLLLAFLSLSLAIVSGCNSPTQPLPAVSSPLPSPLSPYPGKEIPTPTFPPPYPAPTQVQRANEPTADSSLRSSQSQLTEEDNGKTFTYTLTSRFMLFLDDEKYPLENLTCTPEGIIGYVSNGSLNGPDNYPIMFEAVQSGECLLQNGDFQVHIVVSENP